MLIVERFSSLSFMYIHKSKVNEISNEMMLSEYTKKTATAWIFLKMQWWHFFLLFLYFGRLKRILSYRWGAQVLGFPVEGGHNFGREGPKKFRALIKYWPLEPGLRSIVMNAPNSTIINLYLSKKRHLFKTKNVQGGLNYYLFFF